MEGKGAFLRVMKEVWKKWPLLIVTTAFVIGYAYAMSITPLVFAKVINLGICQRNLYNIVKYSMIYLGIIGISGILWLLVRYFSELLSQGISHEMRMRAFEAVYSQGMEFFDRFPRGQLVARLVNDTTRIGRSVSWQVRNIFNVIFTAGISLYYMFQMNRFLFLIVLASMGGMAASNIRYMTLLRPLYEEIRHQIGVITSVVTDNLNGFKTVRALSIEEQEIEKFRRENERFYELNLRAAKVRSLYGSLSQLVLGLTLASIAYFGGVKVISGTLSLGDLAAFISYVMLLMWPMRALAGFLNTLQRGIAAAKRVFEVIDQEPQVKGGDKDVEGIRGEVSFEDVHFSYVPGKEVLKGVSFKVSPGEKVMIVGPPGSGKSTILKLLLRYYDPDSGSIKIDGRDIREFSLEGLRKAIGVVHQESFIFSGTIRENIEVGRPGASLSEIERAAKIAKIHDFISSLPQGYDSLVGERGITLSGGQRQRIDIARVVLKDPKIVLLDDPVSNLDAETEAELTGDLRRILDKKTTIIVSQRLSLSSLADRILVMEDGKIVEEGTHEELMRKKGLYYRLYIAYSAREGDEAK